MCVLLIQTSLSICVYTNVLAGLLSEKPLLRVATITFLEEWLIHSKKVPSDQTLRKLQYLTIHPGLWRRPIIRLVVSTKFCLLVDAI